MIKKIYELLLGLIRLKKHYSTIDQSYFNKKILVNSIKSDFNNLAIDLYIGLLCAARGAQVEVVLDNGLLAHQDLVQKMESKDYLNPLTKLKYRLRYLIVTQALKWIVPDNMSIITTLDINKLLKCSSEFPKLEYIILQQHAKDSCNRYFQGTVNEKSWEYQEYFDKSMLNCQISQLIGMYAVNVFNSTHFLTSHGIYSCWGPAYDYIKTFSQNSRIVYGVNTYFSEKIFMSSEKLQCTASDERLLRHLNSPIGEEKIKIASEYLEERLNAKTKDTSVYYAGANQNLQLSEDYKNILVCPNVFWDGDIHERNRIFENMTQWIIETLQIAKKSPSYKFYIRFHPAEVMWYKNCVKFSQVIESLVSDLHEIQNVHILDSDLKLDLYSVLKDFDALCVYDGMVAIEAAYLGVPIIFVGDGRYNVRNFGHQPVSRLNYQELFGDPGNFMADYDILSNKTKSLEVLSWYLTEASVHLDTMDNLVGDFGTSLMNISSRSFSLENPIYGVMDSL